MTTDIGESQLMARLGVRIISAVFGLGIVLVAVPAAAQNVTGTVFRDVDANGALDPASPAEVGVGGVTITVYDASVAVLGTTATASDGTYTVTGGAPSEEVRVELTGLAGYLLSGPAGADSETTVAFVTMPTSGNAGGVDFGVANPAQHCSDDPNAVTNCYIQGDQSGTDGVLVSFPYTATGNAPAPAYEALENQIGTTWGLAYQRSSDSLFAGSFQKRHAGYGDGTADGTAAIYRLVDPDDATTAGISTFVNLNTLFGSQVAGANPHPTGSDFNIDAPSYAAVGKISFGDLDISEDELTLWAVNLADRRLYEIPLGTDPATPTAPTMSSQVDRHDLFDLYDCDGDGMDDTMADVDIRPFALKVHDGLVYVGLVCSAESTALNADLRALVFSFDPATDTFTNVLDFGPLTYARGMALTGPGCPGTYPADWNYWQDAYPGGTTVVCTIGGGTVNEIAYPMPLLTDIELAVDGTMLLGLRDRFGDMQGFNIEDPDGPAGDLHAGDGYGDILRATPGGPGWVVSAVEATNGTEFFADDDWTDTSYVHTETSSGGLALRPGNEEILYTRMDPIDGGGTGVNDFSAGLRWHDTTSGVTNNQYEIYDPDTAGTPGIFGKGNGLGDLELICDVPPIQVGNRLWIDLDRDGVQDPGEPPLAGIAVQLIDTDGSTVLDTATTAADGTYFFSNGPGTSTASSRFGITGLTANSALGGSPFTLRVDLTQAALAGYFPTFADADATANGEARDSDGAQSGSDVEISFDTGSSGANVHSYDFGFIPLDASCGDLTMTNAVSPVGLVGPGDTLTYTLTVTNSSGVQSQSGIEIWDVIPAGTTYVPQSTEVSGNFSEEVLRVTEYYLDNDGTDDFTGTTYDLTLDQALAQNYFVMVRGSDGDDTNIRGPDESYARLIDDPFATGELGSSGAADVLTLERENAVDEWVGVVTVVECLTDCDGNGFELLDVREIVHGTSSSGSEDITGTWPAIADVLLMGGFYGAGCTTSTTSNANHNSCWARLYPSGTQTINWTRDGTGAGLVAATSTVMAVAWGSDWTVDRVNVTGTNGGDGANAIGEYNTAAITSVTRAETWVWGTGHTDDNGLGDGGEGVLVTLGNGVAQNANETVVAVATEYSGTAIDFEVYVMSHSDLVTDQVFKGDGDTGALTVDGTVTAATSPTQRMALSYNGCNGAGNWYPRPIFSARYTADTTVTLERRADGQPFPAWLQAIDFSGIEATLSTLDNVPGGANPDLAVGDPNQLVVADDNLVLLPSEAITVTFQVTVDDPLTSSRLINAATVDSAESASCTDYAKNDAAAAAMGDLVWLDVDGDAVLDIGEVGIPNVEVTLFADDDGTPGPSGGDTSLGTTLTDANGLYLFGGLGAGDYYTQVTGGVPGGLTLTSPATNPAAVVTLAAGEIDLDSDFPYSNQTPATAVIGDYVWSDADNDGVQDPGEPGIGGVTLQLLSAGPDGVFGTGDEVVEDTQVTTADGRYLFTNVSPGEYVVDSDTAGVLGGYTLTSGPQSNPDPTLPISVAADDVYLKADFGYFQAGLGTIGNQVWRDANDDGTFQSGTEAGIAGVTVDLILDSDGDGTQDPGELVIATAVTAADGTYSFDGLLLDDGGGDADYLVEVTDTASALGGLIQTTGGSPGIDDNSQVIPYAVALSGGTTSNQTADFGYNSVGRLGDLVWADADSDGVKDPEELGIPGVTLELYFDRDGDGVFEPGGDDGAAIDTTVTDTFGNYLFDGLAPGTWFVTVDDTQAALTGYTQTTPDDDPDPGDQQQESLAAPGDANLEADFGYVNAALADLSGNVFNNRDRDGCDDGVGEEGIAGVTVDLLDVSGNVLARATTDSSGDYSFADLPAATYTVRVTDAAGVLDDYFLTSGRDELDVTVAAMDVTADAFGYARVDETGKIAGTVWIDVDVDPPPTDDPDGLRGPTEAGLTMVYVSLYRDVDADGLPEPGGDDAAGFVATAVVDANGDYLFESLATGSYFVDLGDTTLPASLAPTVGTNDPSDVLALSDGECFVGPDFGYRPAGATALLGDRIWYDADGDGLQDPGEAGIGGVDVTYVGAGADTMLGTGDDTTATTTTAPDGTYLFAGLAADDYVVFFDPATLPAGLGPIPTNTLFDSTYNVTLAAGDVVTQVDWGFTGGTFGTIGDALWLDLDASGDVGAGEAGLDTVTVNLIRDVDGDGAWDPDGADNVPGNADDEKVLATMATAGGGAYLFAGLPLSDSGDGDASDADYLVDVTDSGAVLAGLDKTSGTAGMNDNSQADPYAVALTGVTTIDLTGDFGYAPAACSGSLGTIVWHDLDMNGVRNAGEPPIEGVTIAVWYDVDGNGMIDAGTDNLLRTVATDFNGEYELKGLPFGDYLVDLTDEAGVVGGMLKTSGAAGMDDNSQADPYAVTLTALAPDDVTADFGYRDDPMDVGLEISGTVFIDADVDGMLAFNDLDGDLVYDPALSPDPQEMTTEDLVQSATMLLFRVVGGTRQLIGRTTTDVFGFYRFTDLPPGDYEVDVDVTATSADGFIQTTQTTTGGVQQLTLADTSDADWTQPNTNDSRNNNFGFYDASVTFTPVTLSYFAASSDGERLEIEWQTSTEIGHVGFNVWTWRDGAWQTINEKLIPSAGVDSIDALSYRHRIAGGTGGGLFILEDVDVRGGSRFHGPFALGRDYGRRDLTREKIDWAGIRQGHEAARVERFEASRFRLRLEKAGGGSVRLLVDSGGIYRVTHADLAAAGLDLTGVPAADVAVLNAGVPWPVHVEAPGGVFGPGAWVEMVGYGLDTLYTTTNVYTLRVDPEAAARVAADAAGPSAGAPPATYTARVRTERNQLYSFGSPTGDPWYDTAVLSFGAPASANFTFRTDNRVPGAGPVHLDVSLWGETDFVQASDHHVLLAVGCVTLADETFDGLVDYPVSFEVPEAVLLPGDNTLTVTLPGDTGLLFDLVNVESWEVSYPRAFEATGDALEFEAAGEVLEVGGLTSPEVTVYRLALGGLERLTGVQVLGVPGDYTARFPGSPGLATYWVASGSGVAVPALEPGRPPADLKSGPAELLIVSHPDFLGGLSELIGAKQANGWSVKAVDVEGVYEHFGHGVFDPRAIRDYVDFARENLETRAVLLVGGDTYDYHDYLGLGGVSFIPSLYGQTGDFVRYAPADGLIADGDGDEVPDVAIGRFPVRTPADLASIVAKTLEWEQLADRRSLVMAADDYDEPSRFDFTLSSEQLATLMPLDWQLDRVYVDELGVGAARTELLDLMNAGPAVTSFMGHSGPTEWSFDGLFAAGDAVTLTNAGAPMVIAQWGCWTTYYVSPESETLAHKLLLSGDRGAAAVLGATTLTEARSERALSLEIFNRLFEPGQTLGQVILDAKRTLATNENPAVLDVLLGWNLLGDPTLVGFDGVMPPTGLIFADGFESGDTSAWSVP